MNNAFDDMREELQTVRATLAERIKAVEDRMESMQDFPSLIEQISLRVQTLEQKKTKRKGER
jgi:hypothetical protein